MDGSQGRVAYCVPVMATRFAVPPCAVAARSAASPQVISFSRAQTVVPTYECFNRCSYCSFRQNPPTAMIGQASLEAQLDSAVDDGVRELLVLSGEVHPRSPRRPAWFKRVREVCEAALQRGLLPHTNVGPLAESEMMSLREVNVSMGLMVEQVTPKLLDSVHRLAPSKVPSVRTAQLRLAGRLGIPFTTGLLLGIGEGEDDWVDTCLAINAAHEEFGHIQECIVQPFSPGGAPPADSEGITSGETDDARSTFTSSMPAFALERLPQAVKLVREVLSESITVQVPPNLSIDPTGRVLGACIRAGARDLGGIGPRDEVNPLYPFPAVQHLRKLVEREGYRLEERLPIYSRYDGWLPNDALKSAVSNARGGSTAAS